MAMYSVSVTPLIASLQDAHVNRSGLLMMLLLEAHSMGCVTGGPDFRILAHIIVIILMLSDC